MLLEGGFFCLLHCRHREHNVYLSLCSSFLTSYRCMSHSLQLFLNWKNQSWFNLSLRTVFLRALTHCVSPTSPRLSWNAASKAGPWSPVKVLLMLSGADPWLHFSNNVPCSQSHTIFTCSATADHCWLALGLWFPLPASVPLLQNSFLSAWGRTTWSVVTKRKAEGSKARCPHLHFSRGRSDHTGRYKPGWWYSCDV